MPEFKIFDRRTKTYVGSAGEQTAFTTRDEAFKAIYEVLAPDGDDRYFDVHDCDKNIAYHLRSIETDCSIRIEQSRHRIDPNRRMIVDAIKVWSHRDRRYIGHGGAQEDRDREFESFEKANAHIAAICSRPQFKRKDYVARYVAEYV